MSLISLANHNVDRRARARDYSERITQSEDGSVQGASTSFVGSSGKNLILETTSLAVISWINSDPNAYASNIKNGL